MGGSRRVGVLGAVVIRILGFGDPWCRGVEFLLKLSARETQKTT